MDFSHKKKIIFLLTMMLCLFSATGIASPAFKFLPNIADSIAPTVKISLLTCAPGSEIYELEGHSGLRIEYAPDIDLTANWGVFDFAAPNFVYRFVKGETDYSIGICPTYYFVESYRLQNRRVTQQTFRLTPSQARKVVELVDENLLESNRVYRYNYVLDNCATRIVDILQQATGHSIQFNPADSTPIYRSFRQEMQHFHRNYPWYQLGIDFALGPGIDKEITFEQSAFAPEQLRIMMANAMITTQGDSHLMPFVTDTQILSPGALEGIAKDATPFYLTPLFIMWLLAAIAISISAANFRKGYGICSRIFDTTIFTALGINGCVIAFLVFISVHEASSPNYLLIWQNPLLLVGAILLNIQPLTSWLKAYCILLTIATILTAILLIAVGQTFNAAFVPLMLITIVRALTIFFKKNTLKKAGHE